MKTIQNTNWLRAILLLILLGAYGMSTRAQSKPPLISPGNKEMVCFVYHRFDDNRYASTNISASVFRSHMNYLKDQKYKILTLSEAVHWLKTGGNSSDRVVILTIDDGYKSFYTYGFPILLEFGFKATVFINTNHVGDKDYMSWEQLRKINKAGMEIGCHSHAHGHFLDFSGQEMLNAFARDLSMFKRELKEKLGIQSKVYSYPFGEFNEQLELLIKNAGFSAACAQNSGVIDQSSDLWSLPRYPMGGPYASLIGFIEKVNMHPLPVKWEKPESTIMTSNPPELTLCLDHEAIDLDQLQCFIHGDKECIITFEKSTEGQVIKIRSINQLPNRRTLYTITAPRLDGKGWCWYSRLWINTDIEE
ncbi:MAG: polysaccharide deacetylase family protein [Bacteroidota bacterium]|nr:polysaccharide deacetylase family protein [Bacteroidota bacterium]